MTDSPRDSDPPSKPEGMTADDFDAPREHVRRAVSALVGSTKGRELITSFIHERLGPRIEPALLDDLLQSASVEAITSRWLPLFEGGIRKWLRRVTRRAVAHHFRAQQVHRKYLDRGAIVERERDRDDHGTDVAARELRILQWLRTVVTDGRDQQTLALMFEHEEAGTPLAELAAREKTTDNALSVRFHKLRKKYAPKLALMDDEPRRRTVLVMLVLLGLGAALALALWLLRGPEDVAPPAPPHVKTLAPRPAPVPTFDQALPPPEPAPEPPQPLKP